LELREMTEEELVNVQGPRLGADVIIYRSGLLGTLAQRRHIGPFDREELDSPQFDRRDIFDLPRLREVDWGGEVYAVPLGSPQWTLVYRRDIFEKLRLTPPGDWLEYAELARQLADRAALGELAPAEGEPWHGTIEPLAPSWAAHVLLARAASYAKHRSQYSTLFEYQTMSPLIAGPPFVRALEELCQVVPLLPDAATEIDPESARREFLRGACAMSLTWPSAAADQSSESGEGKAGFAELPGADTAYNYRSQQWESRGDEDADRRVTLLGISGRLGSVTHESRQKNVAANFLTWVAGELSDEVCVNSRHTTLFRASQVPRAAQWVDKQFDAVAAEQYGAALENGQNRAGWLYAIRIPGRREYLAALDEAVRSVVAEDQSAVDALNAVAQQWEKITDTLGRDSQREAYMRSIGLEP
jgi:multiple sugar transport system substrate-binding protein